MTQDNVKSIVFDFGGVLFETSARVLYQERFAQTGRSEEEMEHFLTQVFTKQARSSANLGTMFELTAKIAQQNPEWREDILAFNADREFIKQVKGTVSGMTETLNDIKDAGYTVFGLTNWAADTFQTLKIAYPSVLQGFNNIVVSGEVGVTKPNPKIYQIAQSIFGNPDPKSVIFFDDKEANILAAQQSVGWRGQTFKDANTVRSALGL